MNLLLSTRHDQRYRRRTVHGVVNDSNNLLPHNPDKIRGWNSGFGEYRRPVNATIGRHTNTSKSTSLSPRPSQRIRLAIGDRIQSPPKRNGCASHILVTRQVSRATMTMEERRVASRDTNIADNVSWRFGCILCIIMLTVISVVIISCCVNELFGLK